MMKLIFDRATDSNPDYWYPIVLENWMRSVERHGLDPEIHIRESLEQIHISERLWDAVYGIKEGE